MHARKHARDAYLPAPEDDTFFAARGDVVFADSAAAREFAHRIGSGALTGPEVAAMALVHEVLHVVIGRYRERNPGSFRGLISRLQESMGGGAKETLLAFLRTLPPPAVYNHLSRRGSPDDSPERFLERGGEAAITEYTEEVLLLWLTNQNPAYEPVRAVVSDHDLGPQYRAFVTETQSFFANEPSVGPKGQTLIDLLLEPSRRAPNDIFAQLAFIEEKWASAFGLDQLPIWRRVLWAKDFKSEEGRYFLRGGPGPGAPLLDPMQFDRVQEEPKRFSADLDWMPRLVLIAKTVFVWLDQLSKKYKSNIHRLDQVPDQELDLLASRGFTGLWLIGLFERSRASKKIKQMRGDSEAVASAYSLKGYDIAAELGGFPAYEDLKSRAWSRGIRLAADMVPNHVGIDGDWVINHPDWFIQTSHPPFPGYRFGGADLSEDARVGVFIEEGYWNSSDAAVVFRRLDRWSGENRFIYHGNDGTSMPWNDTAQLDYTKAEVRKAAIETILHVARLFPIIRFDAAMTLAKKHFQRLWFPIPGQGDGIPSRSDYAMTREEFDRVFPVEFWREVVDTVAQRAPDTLLLAEAFWMMEGYFVRSLGMHRVYNSAFMNMLKREENEKYRATIKNVLDFEPEILKRFVNFMNNPDEETAVAQFGNDDKYFGVCTLMCTMPGLPMFGHGQVEGFHEKYGMEYRRAKWDEEPNAGLVARHAREIFPLLHKRYLFSGVDEFSLYDFMAEGGGVDEDVFAYSNRAGDEKALVVYNNKFKTTRGRIHHAVVRGRSLGDAFGLDLQQGEWLVFRNVSTGLEHVRPLAEVLDGGFYWELDAFKYAVLMEFRAVHATRERPYGELAAFLSGRGVPSVEHAAAQMYYRPVHKPLVEALTPGHLAYLAKGWDAAEEAVTEEALEAFEEKLRHLADGLAWMLGKAKSAAEATVAASPAEQDDERGEREEAEDEAPAEVAPETKTGVAAERYAAVLRVPELETELLLAWVIVDAALELLAAEGPALTGSALIEAWAIPMALVDAFVPALGEQEGNRRATLVLLGLTMPHEDLRTAMRAALQDGAGRSFMNVHEASGVVWLVKERFEELARFLAERETVLGRSTLEDALEECDQLSKLAAREGYRAERIAAALKKNGSITPPSSGSAERKAPRPPRR